MASERDVSLTADGGGRAARRPGWFIATPRRFLLGVAVLATVTFATSELTQSLWMGWETALADRLPLEATWHVAEALFLLALTGSMPASLLIAGLVQLTGYSKLAVIQGTVSIQEARQLPELWGILTLGDQVLALVAAGATLALLAWLWRPGARRMRGAVLAGVLVPCAAAWLAPATALAFLRPHYHQPAAWHRQVEVEDNGLLSAFVYQSLRMKTSFDELLADAEILTQFPPHDFRSIPPDVARSAAGSLPNIHLLMLESFVHPDYLRTHAGDALTYSEPVLRGSFARLDESNDGFGLSPTYGGGTAMTEFELICGVPSLKGSFEPIAFNLLGGHPARCLPWYLGQMGYRTVASAANHHTYFNSEAAYTSAGFDELHFRHHFDLSDLDGVWLSTVSSLRQNLTLVGDLTAGPVFNYHATVAAHVPYDRDVARRPDAISIAEPVHESVHRVVQHSHYTSIAVSEWLDTITGSDPDALIVIVSDHLPPLSSDEEWAHLFGPDLAPHVREGHRTLHNKWTTYALVVHRGEVLPLGGVSLFDLPSVIVDVITGGALCAQGACLSSKPYLLRRPIFRRDLPARAACKTDGPDEPPWCAAARTDLKAAVSTFRSVVKESNTRD